jgi:nucleotide-binding universal stress UspA family protein
MTMLVAYDGRENTEKAVDYAIRNSKVYSEQLIILSVVTRDGKLDEVREKTEAARRRAEADGADVKAIVESGEPDKVILQTASRFGCDTIIVGRSNRKSSFDRVVMGSVSNSIVANAGCTVVVVQ